MAGALRKTMEYLGLAEVDELEASGYGAGYGRHGAHEVRDDEDGELLAGEWDAVDADEYGQHADDVEEEAPPAERRSGYGRVTPLHPRSGLAPVAEPRRAAAAPEVPELRRITTIHPRTYNEAKSIGESFRGGIPVIMNLTDMSDADAKRLVDFSAGLVFGLRGSIERVTNKVFLLSPEHVTVTGEAPVARAPHLFNQS